jgi:beta-lactamase class D
VTVYGQTGLAVSGLNDSFTAWFIGFAYNDDGHPIATAVVIENERDAQQAARLGGQALSAALNP